jgi:hypothetical protein
MHWHLGDLQCQLQVGYAYYEVILIILLKLWHKYFQLPGDNILVHNGIALKTLVHHDL